MEALKRKWNSCRGASILLALLVLLVCIMVGASVVMAAASNAGKIQSNKEEQQKYLTLSSAMTLLCDELQNVSYVGVYEYEKLTVYMDETTGGPLMDADGNPVTTTAVHHYIHTYTQKQGDLSGVSWLGDVLPLRNDLDYAFAENIESFEVDAPDAKHTSSYRSTLTIPAASYTLEFKLNDAGYGDLSDDKVSIKVEQRNDGSFLLTGTLCEKQEGDSWEKTLYTMKALLSPNDRPDKLLVPASSPTLGENKTTQIEWTLEYIYKEEVSPVAAPTPTT